MAQPVCVGPNTSVRIVPLMLTLQWFSVCTTKYHHSEHLLPSSAYVEIFSFPSALVTFLSNDFFFLSSSVIIPSLKSLGFLSCPSCMGFILAFDMYTRYFCSIGATGDTGDHSSWGPGRNRRSNFGQIPGVFLSPKH